MNTKRFLLITLTAMLIFIAFSSTILTAKANLVWDVSVVHHVTYQDAILNGTEATWPWTAEEARRVLINVTFKDGTLPSGHSIYIRVVEPRLPGGTIHTVRYDFTANNMSIAAWYPDTFLAAANNAPNNPGWTGIEAAGSSETSTLGKYTIYLSFDGNYYFLWGYFYVFEEDDFNAPTVKYDAIRTTWEAVFISNFSIVDALHFPSGADKVHLGFKVYQNETWPPPYQDYFLSRIPVTFDRTGVGQIEGYTSPSSNEWLAFYAGSAEWEDYTGGNAPSPIPAGRYKVGIVTYDVVTKTTAEPYGRIYSLADPEAGAHFNPSKDVWYDNYVHPPGPEDWNYPEELFTDISIMGNGAPCTKYFYVFDSVTVTFDENAVKIEDPNNYLTMSNVTITVTVSPAVHTGDTVHLAVVVALKDLPSGNILHWWYNETSISDGSSNTTRFPADFQFGPGQTPDLAIYKGKYVVDVVQWDGVSDTTGWDWPDDRTDEVEARDQHFGTTIVTQLEIDELPYFYAFKMLRVTIRTGDAYRIGSQWHQGPVTIDIDTRDSQQPGEVTMEVGDSVQVKVQFFTPSTPGGVTISPITLTGIYDPSLGTYGHGIVTLDAAYFTVGCRSEFDVYELAGRHKSFLQDPEGYWVKNDFPDVEGSPYSPRDDLLSALVYPTLQPPGTTGNYYSFNKAYGVNQTKFESNTTAVVYWYHFDGEGSVDVEDWLDEGTPVDLITTDKKLTINITETPCTILSGERATAVAILNFTNDKYPWSTAPQGSLPEGYYAVFNWTAGPSPNEVKLTFPDSFSWYNGTRTHLSPPVTGGRYSLQIVANTAYLQHTMELWTGNEYFYAVDKIMVETKAKYIAASGSNVYVADTLVTTETNITVWLYCITLYSPDTITLNVTVSNPGGGAGWCLYVFSTPGIDPSARHEFPTDFTGLGANTATYGQYDIVVSNDAQNLTTWRHPLCKSYGPIGDASAWEEVDPDSLVYPYFQVVNVDTAQPVYDYWDEVHPQAHNVTVYGTGFKDNVNYYIWIYLLRDHSVVVQGVGPYTGAQLSSGVNITRALDWGTYFLKISESDTVDCPDSYANPPIGGIPSWWDLTVNAEEDWALSCFFGVWGEDKRAYGVGETITTKGGGAAPGDMITVDLASNSGAGTIKLTIGTVPANESGEWEISWKIPYKWTTFVNYADMGHYYFRKYMNGTENAGYTFDYSVTPCSDPTNVGDEPKYPTPTGKHYSDYHDIVIVDVDTYDRDGPASNWDPKTLEFKFQRNKDAYPYWFTDDQVIIHWSSFELFSMPKLTIEIYGSTEGCFTDLVYYNDTVPYDPDYFKYTIPGDALQRTYEVRVSGLTNAPNGKIYPVTATCHFGVWGPDLQTKSSWGCYYRGQDLIISGGGAYPGSEVNVTVSGLAGTEEFLRFGPYKATADSHGNWTVTWQIPLDLSPVDATYAIEVWYDLSYDSNTTMANLFPKFAWLWNQTNYDEAKVDIKQAELHVNVTTDNEEYQIGEYIYIWADITYKKSGKPMTDEFAGAYATAYIQYGSFKRIVNLAYGDPRGAPPPGWQPSLPEGWEPGWSPGDVGWYGWYYVMKGDPDGPWKIIVEAYDGTSNNNGQGDTVVTVFASLKVNVTTDKGGYQRTETIHVTVELTYENLKEPLPEGYLRWRILCGTSQVVAQSSGYPALSVSYPDSNPPGFYTFEYKIKVDDYIGIYTITVDAEDSGGLNSGTGSVSVEVDISKLYVTVWTDTSSYSRYDKIFITALITYSDGSEMLDPDAQVIAHIYHLDGNDIATVILTPEIDTWHGSYFIDKDDKTGSWYVKVEAHDSVTPKPNYGYGKSDQLTISSADLSFTLNLYDEEGNPRTSFKRFEKVTFEVVVEYPDGSDMTTGTVTLWIGDLGGEADSIGLHYDNSLQVWRGYYTIQWDDPSWTGTYHVINVLANDGYIYPNEDSEYFYDAIETIRVELLVSVTTMRDVYMRTETIYVYAKVTYPCGALLTPEKARQVYFDIPGLTISSVYMEYDLGFWLGSVEIPYDQNPGTYTIELYAEDIADWPNDGYGYYDITINPAGLNVDVYFETAEAMQRTETNTIKADITYPDGSPMDSGDVEITITERQSGTVLVDHDYMSWESGPTWTYDFQIPWDAPLYTYDVLVEASDDVTPDPNTGTGQSFFDVFVAVLTVEVETFYDPGYSEPATGFDRLDTIYIQATVTYPDGSALDTTRGGQVIAKLYVLGETGEVGTVELTYYVAGQTWRGTILLNEDAKVGDYFLTVDAKDIATDGQSPPNPKCNYGSGKLEGLTVGVTGLTVIVSTDKPSYKRLETITIEATVTYTIPVTTGTVFATIREGSAVGPIIADSIGLHYDSTKAKWIGTYMIKLDDPIGTWYIRVDAVDDYGNAGWGSVTTLVNPAAPFTVLITTDKTTYGRLETVTVNILVLKVDGTPYTGLPPSAFTCTITRADTSTVTLTVVELGAGYYKGMYPITASDPYGLWKADCTVNDGIAEASATPAYFYVAPAIPPSFVSMLIFDDYANRMGMLTPAKPAKVFYFPHFHQDLSWETYIAVINPTPGIATVTLTAYSNTGSVLATRTEAIPPYNKFAGFVNGIFSGLTGTGWIKVESDVEVIGLLNFDDYASRMGSLSGVTPEVAFYFAHFHQDASWQTYISIVNPNTGAASVTLVAYSNAGTVLATKSMSLAGLNKVSGFVDSATLFGPSLTGKIGWIKVTSDIPIVGLLNFDDYANRMGSIEHATSSTSIYFPHFRQDSAWQTYIAFTNPNPTTATVTATAYSSAGVTLASTTITMAGNSKVGGFVNGVFPGLTGTGWISVESNIPIVGLVNIDDRANRMGSALATTPQTSALFAHFHQDVNWETFYAVVNLGPSLAVTTTYYRNNGMIISATASTIATNNKIYEGAAATGVGWIRVAP